MVGKRRFEGLSHYSIAGSVLMKRKLLIGVVILACYCFCSIWASPAQMEDDRFLSFVTEPAEIGLYWKDEHGQVIGSIQNLKCIIERKGRKLRFAMNGGMYTQESSPLGLYIENKVTLSPLNNGSGEGNFYLKPNGFFYITGNNKAVICRTPDFRNEGNIKFATQSGPMLLWNGAIHPVFKKGSAQVNIRNGVGILPDHRVIFAISKQEVNFYDFAAFFKNRRCQAALYLDGFVSQAYAPEQHWMQLDGAFGVMIGVLR